MPPKKKCVLYLGPDYPWARNYLGKAVGYRNYKLRVARIERWPKMANKYLRAFKLTYLDISAFDGWDWKLVVNSLWKTGQHVVVVNGKTTWKECRSVLSIGAIYYSKKYKSWTMVSKDMFATICSLPSRRRR